MDKEADCRKNSRPPSTPNPASTKHARELQPYTVNHALPLELEEPPTEV